jgi:peptidoglycan/xylan/chitin deacetylase (PgdA/CDA1 family)
VRYFERAPFVPIGARPHFAWPNGARLAVWIVPNIECFDESSLVGNTTMSQPKEPPDIGNYAWRDYGMRVGVWRQIDQLQRLGIRATVALNSNVCHLYPEVVEACVAAGWELMGHGRTNSEFLFGMSKKTERAVIAEVFDTIERASGRRPAGWLGPGLGETPNTVDLLAECGARYVADWVNDDQPYRLKTKRGDLISVPYSVELNDLPVFLRRGAMPEDFERMIVDQFEVLYREGATSPRVMCIALHPYITGVPYRAARLEAALGAIKEREGVWFATGTEIVEAYLTATA